MKYLTKIDYHCNQVSNGGTWVILNRTEPLPLGVINSKPCASGPLPGHGCKRYYSSQSCEEDTSCDWQDVLEVKPYTLEEAQRLGAIEIPITPERILMRGRSLFDGRYIGFSEIVNREMERQRLSQRTDSQFNEVFYRGSNLAYILKTFPPETSTDNSGSCQTSRAELIHVNPEEKVLEYTRREGYNTCPFQKNGAEYPFCENELILTLEDRIARAIFESLKNQHQQ